MSGYWILVLHCTTSGADGGAAKFAFQHSTVSQQVIIICNTLIDNYISTAWIVFVVYFIFFCNCRITSKCDLRWRQCPLSKYQQICTFYPRQQEIPFPSPPRPARNGNERMSFFCWFYPQCPLHLSKPPTQQCLSYPFSAGPDHEWPHSTIVTTQWWLEPSMIPSLVIARAVTVFSPRTKWLNS